MLAARHPSARSFLFGAIGFFFAVVFLEVGSANVTEWGKASARDEDYNLLVEGFQAGRLSLNKEVPAGLARLPDPYDPAANAQYRAWPYELHDLSYFRGKLYLYFGITPALALFWPWAALTHDYLSQRCAVAIFCTIGLGASLAMLDGLCRRYFPGIGRAVSAALAAALGLLTGALILLQRPEFWEVPIACGYAFGMLALLGVWRALHAGAARAGWLALASLALGFAVGARPSLLFGSVMLLVPVFCEGHRPAGARRQSRTALAAAAILPAMFCGAGLLYNQMRFGQPFEFGEHYQLALDRQDTAPHFSPRFLWFNFRVYFLEAVHWTRHFPFTGRIASPPLPAGHVPVDDPFGVLACLPVLGWAAAAPLAWRGRTGDAHTVLKGWVTAAAILFCAAAVTLCLFYGNCSRYETEFLPPLALLAVVGILGLERALSDHSRWRLASRFAWVLALAFSSAFILLASVEHYAEQRARLGDVLLQLGRPKEAVVQYEAVARAEPEGTDVYVNLGNALMQLSEFPRAAESYRKALQLDPNSAQIHGRLADVLARLQRLPEAEAQYREALRLDPDSLLAHFNLAELLARTGRGPEAIRHLETVARIQTDDPSAQSIVAMALAQIGRSAEAVDHFARAVQAEPANPDVRINFGNALIMMGRAKEAVEQYEAALQLVPDQAEVRYHLALALQSLGRTAEADRERARALALRPELGRGPP